MKLYEVIERRPVVSTLYFTSQAAATAAFVDKRKDLRKQDKENLTTAMPGRNWPAGWQNPAPYLAAGVYQVELRTNLTAEDWIKLLQADAPGPCCEMTPRDLITSRKQLFHWDNLTPTIKGK